MRSRIRSRSLTAAFIALAVCCTGCASLQYSTPRKYRSSDHGYATVLVISALSDPDLQRVLETSVTRTLGSYGARGVPGCDIFQPGKAYSWREFRSILRSEQVDGILIVSPDYPGAPRPTLPTRAKRWHHDRRYQRTAPPPHYGMPMPASQLRSHYHESPTRFVYRALGDDVKDSIWIAPPTSLRADLYDAQEWGPLRWTASADGWSETEFIDGVLRSMGAWAVDELCRNNTVP